MNDKFINQFRKLPESKFVEKVHMQIERKERSQAIKRYSVLSAFALIFVFGMLMTFSSAVRADVLRTINEIAGLRFDVTSNYLGDPSEEIIIVPGEHLSLEDAQSRFASPIMLPTYMLQGYERSNNVELFDFGDMPMLVIRWSRNEPFGHIHLEIQHCSPSLGNCGLTVGEDSLEEIMLNEKPAVIVRGAWMMDTKQYDLSVVTAIRWKYDENTVYTLGCSNSEVSLEELIKIAESIQ